VRGTDRRVHYPDPDGVVNWKRYNEAGNLIAEKVDNLPETKHFYDSLGRLVRTIDARGNHTQYKYDVYGNRTKLIDPAGNTTTWVYDDHGRLSKEIDQLNNIDQFEYDPAGRLAKHILPNNDYLEYTYDVAHRTTTEKWFSADGTQLKTILSTYDEQGRLVSVDTFNGSDTTANPQNAVSWLYESGRLRQESILFPTLQQVHFVHAYDKARPHELDSISTKVLGKIDSKTTFDWTNDGLMQSIGFTVTTSTGKAGIGAKYTYDGLGRVSELNRYRDDKLTQSVFSTQFSYTKDGSPKERLQKITHASTSTFASYDLGWDSKGRIESFASSAAGDGTATFTYDATNQLTGVDYSVLSDLSFTYNSNGSRDGSGYGVGTDNRQTTSPDASFQYNTRGGRSQKTNSQNGEVTEYRYDHRNRLTDVIVKASAGGAIVRQFRYAYDGIDRRIQIEKDLNGDNTFEVRESLANRGNRSDRGQAGDQLMLKLDANGVVTNRYLHGAAVDEILAEQNIAAGNSASSPWNWTATDHQGSVRDLVRDVNGTPTVVNHIRYDAFGNTVSETDAAISQLYGYTGREFDEGTSLQYNRARYYDPKLGQFISQDPIGLAGGDANLYRMAGNHTTYAIGPSGLDELSDDQVEAVDTFAAMNAELLAGLRSVRPDRLEKLVGQLPGSSIQNGWFSRTAILYVNGTKLLYDFVPGTTIRDGERDISFHERIPSTYSLRQIAGKDYSDNALLQSFEGWQSFYSTVGGLLEILPGGSPAGELEKGNYGYAAVEFARDVGETLLIVGKLSKLGKLTKLNKLSTASNLNPEISLRLSSMMMVGIEMASIAKNGNEAVGAFQKGDNLTGSVKTVETLISGLGLSFSAKQFVGAGRAASLATRPVSAPVSGGKNLFWHGSAEGVENATKNGLFAHGTGNGSKFWATSRGEQGKLTEILIGGNYNIVAKPPFVQYKGGFGSVYKLTAEEASHFSKAWGFQYSWNPYQWYKGLSGQYYFHPGTVSWAQRATELKRGAAITTAVGVGTWGLVELNDWRNGR
jgi:RHS repeat-associated protein